MAPQRSEEITEKAPRGFSTRSRHSDTDWSSTTAMLLRADCLSPQFKYSI